MSTTPPSPDQLLLPQNLADLTLSSSRFAHTMAESQPQRTPRTRQTFFNDQTVSDIKIKIGTQEYFAHRIVLIEKSIWFEKALLGQFKESKQDVIHLGKDDDPAALVAMLKFCYMDRYHINLDKDSADQHLAMYQLGDLYDIPDLRKYASSRLLNCLSPAAAGWEGAGRDEAEVTDKTVLLIQRVLGPDADSFADNSIQQDVYRHAVKHVKPFYANALFRRLLADGSLFAEAFAQRFTNRVCEIISDLLPRCPACRTSSPPPTVGRLGPTSRSTAMVETKICRMQTSVLSHNQRRQLLSTT